MKCPRCGNPIAPRQLSPGERIHCPGCGKRLKLPEEPGSPVPALEIPSVETEVAAETASSDELDGYALAPSASPVPAVEKRKLPSGLSPRPPSPGPSSQKSSRKKSSPKNTAAKAGSPAWMWIVGGTLATLCVLGGGAATAFWLLRPAGAAADPAVARQEPPAAEPGATAEPPQQAAGKPTAANAAAAPDTAPPSVTHSLVTVDKTDAVASAEAITLADLKRRLPAPDPDATYVRPTRPGASPPPAPQAIWDLKPDTSDQPREPVADDLDIPLEPVGYGLTLPLFSSRGGRFTLIAADEPLAKDAKQARVAKKERPAKRSKRKQEAEKQPTPPRPGVKPPEPEFSANVVDLRSGDIVGQFAGKTLLYGKQHCRLSPDAKYLVSIDTAMSTSTESRTLKEGLLFVWRQGEAEPTGTIQMPGDVMWCDFLGPTRLAMLSVEKKGNEGAARRAGVPRVDLSFEKSKSDGVLHIWDVAKQAEVKTIPIKSGPFYLSRDARPSNAAFEYNPAAVRGAVSPGSRYLALGLAGGVGFVSVPEGREIGSIPMETNVQLAPTLVSEGKPAEKVEYEGAIEHRALQFSPDGSQLWNLAVRRYAGPVKQDTLLTAWDVASGRALRQTALAGAVNLLPPGRPSRQALAEAASSGNQGDDGSPGVLLPGPEPETLVFCKGLDRLNVSDRGAAKAIGVAHRTLIFELYAGAQLASLPFVGVRWAGPNRVLAIESAGDDEAVLRTVEFDAAGFKETAAPMLAAVAPRPDVLPADRSSAPLAKSQPPATWTAPPTADVSTNAPSPSEVPRIPVAVGTREAALLSYVRQQTPRNRNEYHWQRFDLQTGKPIGESIRLWPWTASVGEWHMDANTRSQAPQLERAAREPGHRRFRPGDVADHNPLRALPLAALTLDDGRLAACDPANPCRVDVWTADGARVAGLLPYGDKAIEWLGWSAGGKLLTICSGALTAWDIASGKAVYEVEGDFDGPVAYGPARAWLALAHADRVDLIDAESGACLDRCTPTQAGGVIEGLAVAPDGKSLAAARKALPEENPHDPQSRPGVRFADALEKFVGPRGWRLDVWNLADGQSTSLGLGKGQLEFLQWLNPDHLLVVSGKREPARLRLDLFDRLARSVIASYPLAETYERNLTQPAEGLPRLAATGDGRIWLSLPVEYKAEADRYWRSVVIPRPNAPIEDLFLDASREYVDPAEVSVRLEVDLATPARGRSSGERLASDLVGHGYCVGPNGFALRYTHEVLDSDQRFNVNAGKDGLVIPQVAVKWELFDNKGKSLWKNEGRFSFKHEHSRYYDKARKQSLQEKLASPFVKTDWYNFKGQDARQAILDELLDDAAASGLPAYFPLGQFIFAKGQFVTLPKEFEFPNPLAEEKKPGAEKEPERGATPAAAEPR